MIADQICIIDTRQITTIQMLHLILPLTILVLSTVSIQGPVIGIYTQDFNDSRTQTYIASSYVKYIEMAGAQVVPIFYKLSQADLKLQLSQINGVLFPGGGMDLDIRETFAKNADFILKYAKEQNDMGKVFPIWATCLGHQLISYLTSGYDSNVIKVVNGQGATTNTLQFITQNAYSLSNLTTQNFEAITQNKGVLYFNHHWAVYLSYFSSNVQLHSFWNLIATTTSSSNETFVSMMEAKKYPFYSCQFHPQKNSFEWKLDAPRSTMDAIEIPQRLVQAFIEKAKQNPNRYSNQGSLYSSLIYNYPISAYSGDSFQSVYMFGER